MIAVDDLIVALASADDDSARLDLLDGLTADEHMRLQAALFYGELIADCEREAAAECAAFEQFARDLEAAPTDDVRRKVTEAQSADFLREWYWQLTASAQAVWLRYSELLRG